MENLSFNVVVIGAIGIDTNVFLMNDDIDYSIEVNFTENKDYVGQAGGYSARLFSQLGYKTAFIGYVGNDFQGEEVKKKLLDDNINIDALFFDPLGTKRSINLVYNDGRRKNFYDAKSSMEAKPDLDKCRKIMKKAGLLHFSIVNWARDLLPIAKDLNIPISVDLQDLINLDDSYRKDFIEYANILFFSDANLSHPEAIVKQLLERNSNLIVIVGRGSRGCLTGTKNEIKNHSAIETDIQVVDTNGAGDSLAVGFLSSFFLENKSFENSILNGQTLARHVCTIKASTSNMISKEIKNLIKR